MLLFVAQYSENLLMAAIRTGQQDMALFLLDNDIDRNYVTTRLVSRLELSHKQMSESIN